MGDNMHESIKVERDDPKSYDAFNKIDFKKYSNCIQKGETIKTRPAIVSVFVSGSRVSMYSFFVRSILIQFRERPVVDVI